MKRQQRGHAAEQAAVALLRSKGYTILATNYSCRIGELDIVAQDGDELVFIEVRSRASGRYGDALATVGATKQKQVTRVAQAYISDLQPSFGSCRFDVIGQTEQELVHVVDAFRA